MQKVHMLSQFLVKVEEFIIKWTMTALCVVIMIQIVSRNIGFPAGWTTEVALLLSTWMTYIGGALAVQRKTHFVVDLFPDKTGPVLRITDAISTLLVVFFLFYIVWQGFYMTSLVRFRVSGVADISMASYFVALPISGLFMLVHILDGVLNPKKKEG